MLIVLGLLVEIVFGSDAALSLDTLHRFEGASTGHAMDQTYLDARGDLIFDSVAFGTGLLVMAIGLVIVIRWRPVPVPILVNSGGTRESSPPHVDLDTFSLLMPVLPGGLAFAGWLSLATAILDLPLSAANEALRDQGNREVLFHSVYYVISLALYVYPLWQLKRLLNVRYRYREADAVLDWIIGLTLLGLLVGQGADMLGLALGGRPPSAVPGPAESAALSAFTAVGYLPMIWLYRKLGLKVRRLEPDLAGLSRPFALACFATVLYLGVAVWKEAWVLFSLVAIAQYGILGAIFLRASRDGAHGVRTGAAGAVARPGGTGAT